MQNRKYFSSCAIGLILVAMEVHGQFRLGSGISFPVNSVIQFLWEQYILSSYSSFPKRNSYLSHKTFYNTIYRLQYMF